eukprot:7337290-Pyramimonas_sp.AAC.1
MNLGKATTSCHRLSPALAMPWHIVPTALRSSAISASVHSLSALAQIVATSPVVSSTEMVEKLLILAARLSTC